MDGDGLPGITARARQERCPDATDPCSADSTGNISNEFHIGPKRLVIHFAWIDTVDAHAAWSSSSRYFASSSRCFSFSE
jgi:hypothetical protein